MRCSQSIALDIDSTQHPISPIHASTTTMHPSPSPSRSPSRTHDGPDTSALFGALLVFRVLNALLTQTFFQPDEYWQSQEIAHRLVFGYGYLTWEWQPALPGASGVLDGPIRGILHPLLFVPGYALLKLTALDSTRLLVLVPRLQQAVFAAIGDVYTYRLARRVLGAKYAPDALLVAVTNVYSLYTATRTFANTTEAALTAAALFYWPFEPRQDEQRARYKTNLYRALALAALACLLRPTNGILWAYLFVELVWRTVRQKQQSLEVAGDLVLLLVSAARIGVVALVLSVVLDSAWAGRFALAPLAFLYRNVIANLSVFYGAHPVHWYVSQGIPLLGTTWLPFMLVGWWNARATLLGRLAAVTVGTYSLLSHKEARFLQPLLPVFSVLAARHLPRNRALVAAIVGINAVAAAFLLLLHQRGQESAPFHIGRAARGDAPFPTGPPVRSLAFLMPCHSTPWMSAIHWPNTDAAWFIECPPPHPGQAVQGYWDQSDFFYHNTTKYILDRFPEKVDPLFPPGHPPPQPGAAAASEAAAENPNPNPNPLDLGWRHYWPSHIVAFEALVKSDAGSLIRERGYRPVWRTFNTFKHTDSRRDGDLVVLAWMPADP